jgi:lysozyme family protein
MAKFSPAIAKVLKSEGGYINDPKDSGGATN